jgi:virulence factor
VARGYIGAMRIGMIGLGDIARKVYLPLLATRPDAELVGVVSRTAATVARVGRTYRVRGFTELGDLLALRPDIVFVHAPTAAHHELASACLAADASVYVDKPLAPSVAECEDLAVQAERRGRLLAVGFNRRFAPMYVRARSWVAEHGPLAYAIMEKHRASVYEQTPRRAVFDDLIHVLDTLCWLLGPDVRLVASHVRVDGAGRFVLGTGSLRTPDVDATFAMARACGADAERLALHGYGRSAEVIDLEQAAFEGSRESRTVAAFGSWDTIAHRRGFEALVQHVLDTAGTPERCEVAAHRVLAAHHLAEGITAAAGG